ncbi:MAG: hypothetical protein WAV02_10145, partial [Stellaceae bacterium]
TATAGMAATPHMIAITIRHRPTRRLDTAKAQILRALLGKGGDAVANVAGARTNEHASFVLLPCAGEPSYWKRFADCRSGGTWSGSPSIAFRQGC